MLKVSFQAFGKRFVKNRMRNIMVLKHIVHVRSVKNSLAEFSLIVLVLC
jgi:hypothetical protein